MLSQALTMLCVEQFYLRVLSELDQLEGDWMACMSARDPEAVAAAYRLLGHHMQQTMQHLIPAMVISDAELTDRVSRVNAAEPR